MISLISSLRSLKVLGLHPRDSDADDLVKRLKRIGRNVGALWPWPENLPTGGDVVFVEVKEVAPPGLAGLSEPGPGLLCQSPYRAFGLLGPLLMARSAWQERLDALRKEEKLERSNIITGAKLILMRRHRINAIINADGLRSNQVTGPWDDNRRPLPGRGRSWFPILIPDQQGLQLREIAPKPVRCQRNL